MTRLRGRTPREAKPGNAPAHAPAARQQTARRVGPTDVDRHVGRRIRMQRILVGMTQRQLAMLIGVSYKQQHKYERGIGRLTAGRLHAIARALDVGVADLFVELEGRAAVEHDDLTLDLVHAFLGVRDRRHQQAICLLARALSTRLRSDGVPRGGARSGANSQSCFRAIIHASR
jgi:transcriptional regulator with XRE-family HTH domain